MSKHDKRKKKNRLIEANKLFLTELQDVEKKKKKKQREAKQAVKATNSRMQRGKERHKHTTTPDKADERRECRYQTMRSKEESQVGVECTLFRRRCKTRAGNNETSTSNVGHKGTNQMGSIHVRVNGPRQSKTERD